jgi:hypothetical protein
MILYIKCVLLHIHNNTNIKSVTFKIKINGPYFYIGIKYSLLYKNTLHTLQNLCMNNLLKFLNISKEGSQNYILK